MLDKDELQFYADKGYSRTATARVIGYSHETVIKYAKIYGIEFGKQKTKISKELKEKIILELECGMKQADIHRKYNVTPSVVSKISQKMKGVAPVTRPSFVPPVKVRELDLKPEDTFEVLKGEKKKTKELFTVKKFTDDLIVAENRIGLTECFQIKEYVYGLI